MNCEIITHFTDFIARHPGDQYLYISMWNCNFCLYVTFTVKQAGE